MEWDWLLVMTPTFLVRWLLLHPVVIGGILLLSALFLPFLIKRTDIGANLSARERLVGVLIAVSLLAAVLTAVSVRWGGPLGDRFRLRALQRTAIARETPPGVRLLYERSRASAYRGIDEYIAGDKISPGPSWIDRTYRVEGDVRKAFTRFQQVAAASGWKLIGAACGPYFTGSMREAYRNARLYEQSIADFRATLTIAYSALPSTVFPGAVISDIEVNLRAPAVLAKDSDTAPPLVTGECPSSPAEPPKPPRPVGKCDAADAKLGLTLPKASTPLAARPLRPNAHVPPRRMRVRPSDDRIVASSPPSEPRALLEKHGALDGYQVYDNVWYPGYTPGHKEATYAYRFPSHEEAVGFHREVVARACRQAMDIFDVPGGVDVVGLRLYVPATGPECAERWDLQWGLAFGSGCGDWLIDYLAFVRGQYHVSVAVGASEYDGFDPGAIREAALRLGAAAVG